jgi:hypothetical protein
MTTELIYAKSLVELGNIQDFISEELGFATQILERSQSLPLNSLVISLAPDSQQRTRVASLNYLPLGDEDCESIKLLQFYLVIPCELQPDFQRAVEKFLLLINLKAPIGSFTFNAESNEIIAKYVYSLGKFKMVDKEEFLETFMLFMFVIDQFSPLIEEVATGVKSYEDISTELP